MTRNGFRVQSDYRRAIADQAAGRGTADDTAAVQRYQQMAADQQHIRELNALLESFGSNMQSLIQVIQGHTQAHSSTASAIAALQQAIRVINSRFANGSFNHQ